MAAFCGVEGGRLAVHGRPSRPFQPSGRPPEKFRDRTIVTADDGPGRPRSFSRRCSENVGLTGFTAVIQQVDELTALSPLRAGVVQVGRSDTKKKPARALRPPPVIVSEKGAQGRGLFFQEDNCDQPDAGVLPFQQDAPSAK